MGLNFGFQRILNRFLTPVAVKCPSRLDIRFIEINDSMIHFYFHFFRGAFLLSFYKVALLFSTLMQFIFILTASISMTKNILLITFPN